MTIYNQNEFRTFMKCSRLYSYSKEELKHSIEFQILESGIERFLTLYLKKGAFNPDSFYSDAITILNKINKEENFLQSQYERILNKTIVYFSDLKNCFDISKYYPVAGPLYLTKTFDNVSVRMKISGILREKNQTLHVLYFSPYNYRINVLNDPFLQWISESLQHLVKNHNSNRPKSIIHTFYKNESNELEYIKYFKDPSKAEALDYSFLFKALQNKTAVPVTPCRYVCKYKKRCEKENYEL